MNPIKRSWWGLQNKNIVQMWTKTAFFGFPHCAHRSEEESETGGWDGHPAGVYFIHLPASPPPHPSSPFCLQHNLQAPVSPFGIVLPLLGPSFPPPDPLTSYSLSFHPLLWAVWWPVPPSSVFFWMDKLTMAPPLGLASGPSHTSNMPGMLCARSHTFTWRQGN